MMNKPWEKLIALLNLCSDNGDEAKKLRELALITQSSEYEALSNNDSLEPIFSKLYSYPVLQTLGLSELTKRGQAIRKAYSLYNSLTWCVRTGNGPELAHDQLPDFSSAASINELLRKIKVTKSRTNYTNISNSTILALFSEDTISSAIECFNRLPVSLSKSETISESEISAVLGDAQYCIDIQEFDAIHREFLESSKKDERTIAKEKLRRKRHFLLKIALALLCFGAIFGFYQFGLITESFAMILSMVLFGATIVFLIWG